MHSFTRGVGYLPAHPETPWITDHAVTGYGVASPLGRSLAERARELINVADPDHQDQLRFARRTGPLP
jgi:acyl-CoA hydrolase